MGKKQIFQAKFSGLKFFYRKGNRQLKFNDFTYETEDQGEIDALMESFALRCDVWPIESKDDIRKLRDMPMPETRTTIEPTRKTIMFAKKKMEEEIAEAGAKALKPPTPVAEEPKRRGRPQKDD